ncbi:hypothetical protein SAMD00019534_097940, partial [Acytostelium subglobosum LB1]|uniref:hypothetical protein n=1 Tax=Acytostelium subglobosum LB1 TaxID=1410327 RepID=UPI000644F992
IDNNMSDNDQLLKWLQMGGLEDFHPNFVRRRVTCDSFLLFTMQDYGLVGISSLEDRKKLFHLLQQLKKNGGASLSMPSPSSSTTNNNITATTDQVKSTPQSTTNNNNVRKMMSQSVDVSELRSVGPASAVKMNASIDPVAQAKELLLLREKSNVVGGNTASSSTFEYNLKDFDVSKKKHSIDDFLNENDMFTPSTPPRKQQQQQQHQLQEEEDEVEEDVEESPEDGGFE